MPGKIARLSKTTRDQLNQRLDDGQSAADLLRWLNRLPECKAMLKDKFGSRPITRQNLSEWKSGGYQTWLRLQQAREGVRFLAEQAADLEKDEQRSIARGGTTLADRLGALVSVQLLTAIQELEAITEPGRRWQRLTEIVGQLTRLRREDHQGRRIRLAEEQWRTQRRRQAEQDEKERKEAEKARLLAWAFSLFTKEDDIENHGGGERGRRWADWLHRVRNGLPLPQWWPGPWADTHYGPDGTDWSKVTFPAGFNGSKGSSSSSSSPSSSPSPPIAPKSDESGSSSNKTKSPPRSAGLPTRCNSNKTKPKTPATLEESAPPNPVPSPGTCHPSPSSGKVNPSKSNPVPGSAPAPGAVRRAPAPNPPSPAPTPSNPPESCSDSPPPERRSLDRPDSNEKPAATVPIAPSKTIPSTLDPLSSDLSRHGFRVAAEPLAYQKLK